MRITRILVIAAFVLFLLLVSAAASSAAAEPAADRAPVQSLGPPVVARLSDDPAQHRQPVRWSRSGGFASPAGQLTGTVSMIVFALAIAGLASKREAE